jgi:hypothetical protein
VDWVSKVFCDLFTRPEAHGRTYHLAPEKPLTPREALEACYTYYNSYGVEFYEPGTQISGERTLFEELVLPYRQIYESYETVDPKFDRTNLLRYAGHLPCPEIDEPMIHRFLRRGEKERWGKRRESRTESPRHIGEATMKANRLKEVGSHP